MLTTLLELDSRGEIRETVTALVPVKKHEAGASAARSKQADSKPDLIMVLLPRETRKRVVLIFSRA